MDEKTLLHLYRTCYPDIARYIMNRNGTADQAEEAFHAALGAMLHQMEKGASINDYGAYLFRSAWNAFLAERRHNTRHEGPEAPVSHSLQPQQHDEPDPTDEASFTGAGSGGKFRFSAIAEPGPGPEHHANNQLLLEAAEACIATLSKAQQNILKLSFDLEQSLDDDAIAVQLGVSKDYVRVARFRAMEALRAQMYQKGYGYMM